MLVQYGLVVVVVGGKRVQRRIAIGVHEDTARQARIRLDIVVLLVFDGLQLGQQPHLEVVLGQHAGLGQNAQTTAGAAAANVRGHIVRMVRQVMVVLVDDVLAVAGARHGGARGGQAGVQQRVGTDAAVIVLLRCAAMVIGASLPAMVQT